MKKQILLTLAFGMLASVGFAQVKSEMAKKEASVQTSQVVRGHKTAVGPRRSVADGTYYTRPEGMMFLTMDKTLSSYRVSVLAIPPFYETLFKNQCGTNKVTWTINGNDFSDYMVPETGDCWYYDFGKSTVDEEGLNMYYLPTIVNGTKSFTICETDKEGQPNSDGQVGSVPDESVDIAYGYSDFNTNIWYGRGAIVPASNKNDQGINYVYGTGTITFSDGTVCNSVGVAQVFPAPVTPFTANEVNMHALSNTRPLSGDAKLYMEVRNVEEYEGGLTFGDEVYETLVATAEDCQIAYQATSTTYWNVLFHKKVEDDFGIESNAPVIFDKPYALVITGFDQPGCDTGVMSVTMADEDLDIIPDAYPIIQDSDGSYGSFSYQGDPTHVDISFFGFFDAAIVPDALYSSDGTAYEECNILRVSADGEEVKNDLYPDVFDSFVYIEVARDLQDEDENDNYEFDAPEWVSDVQVIGFDDSDESGMYIATIVCEPLPEGTTGRRGEIWLKGSGVTSENPIIVLQGDATNEKPFELVCDAEGWTELVHNGNVEGSDGVSLITKNGEDGGNFIFNPVAGAGINGSKAAVVHAVSNATNEWDSQFFIYAPDYVFSAGDEYKVSFMVRADKPTSVSVQTHTTPGNYIHWAAITDGSQVNIGTEWAEVTYQGTAVAEQEGMQTIAFNLNQDKTLENNFYFDNVSWKVRKDLTGIKEVNNQNVVNSQRYNLNGMRVNANYKGIVIENGKKFIQK